MSQAVRTQIYWLDWTAVQWLMRLLAHFHFSKIHPILEAIVRSVCTRMGDTQMIEEMFRHIRGAETKQQDPKVLDVLALYQKAITNPTPLTQRGILVRSLSRNQWYTKAPASGPTNWVRITAKRGRAALPKACRRVLRGEGYVAKTLASGRPSITAAMSFCLAYRDDRLQHVCGHLADHRGIATRSHHPHHEECRLSGVVVGEVRHADVASHSGVGFTYRRM